MKKRDIKSALTIAFIVTSYITFVLIAVNVGFVRGFLIIWFRSWLVAFLLAAPSLMFVSPYLKKRLNL